MTFHGFPVIFHLLLLAGMKLLISNFLRPRCVLGGAQMKLRRPIGQTCRAEVMPNAIAHSPGVIRMWRPLGLLSSSIPTCGRGNSAISDA